MKASELLNEKPVQSTWITDITHNRPNRTVTMRLSDGKSYSIPGIDRKGFEDWTNYSSKGEYFHTFVKPNYEITRID